MADRAIFLKLKSNSSDGRVVRASASEAVDSGLITSRVKPMTSKLVYTVFPLDAQLYMDSIENNKPASLLVANDKPNRPTRKSFSAKSLQRLQNGTLTKKSKPRRT